jgi:hypothetical protein
MRTDRPGENRNYFSDPLRKREERSCRPGDARTSASDTALRPQPPTCALTAREQVIARYWHNGKLGMRTSRSVVHSLTYRTAPRTRFAGLVVSSLAVAAQDMPGGADAGRSTCRLGCPKGLRKRYSPARHGIAATFPAGRRAGRVQGDHPGFETVPTSDRVGKVSGRGRHALRQVSSRRSLRGDVTSRLAARGPGFGV